MSERVSVGCATFAFSGLCAGRSGKAVDMSCARAKSDCNKQRRDKYTEFFHFNILRNFKIKKCANVNRRTEKRKFPLSPNKLRRARNKHRMHTLTEFAFLPVLEVCSSATKQRIFSCIKISHDSLFSLFGGLIIALQSVFVNICQKKVLLAVYVGLFFQIFVSDG